MKNGDLQLLQGLLARLITVDGGTCEIRAGDAWRYRAALVRLIESPLVVTDQMVEQATKAHFAERLIWRTHGQTWEEGCEIPGWEESKYAAMRVAITAAFKPQAAA